MAHPAPARRSGDRARDLARIGVDRIYELLARRWSSRSAFARETTDPGAFARFGDESCIVPPTAVDGAEHIAIGRGTTILEYSRLSVLPAVGDGSDASPRLRLGDGVRLARFNAVICESEIIIGDEVSSSDYVTILDTWNHHGGYGRVLAGLAVPPAAPVVIEAGAYLGCSATVLPGVVVGEGAYIGEGAVVADDVPAHAVVYGNPAVVVRFAGPNAESGTRRP